MNELPNGWLKVNLFDICRPKQWKTISIKDLTLSGYTVYGANGSIGFYKEYTHEHPTLMITCRGATCGNIHVSKPCSYINGNAMALDYLKTEICQLNYLKFYLMARGFDDVISGSAQPQITQQGLQQVFVFLAPLNEQKRIADKLDRVLARVDACREKCDRIPPILKRFRQSVLAAATSGELTEDWREVANTSPTWKESSLLDLTNKITDGEHLTPKRTSSGKFLLSARNVLNGAISLENVDYVDESEFERIRKRCDPSIGDVLLSCSGSVGRVALVDQNNAYVMVRSAAMIRPRKELLDSSYLMYSLQSPNLQSQIAQKSSATAQANIFLGAIKSLILPIPCLKEQKEIVRRVEILFAYADRLETYYQKARAHCDRLTPAILDKAFRGDLVPQDPNDEPASVLLERIQAERAKATATKTKRAKAVSRKPSYLEVIMLTKKEIQPSHLSDILKEQGSLTAESLWAASKLDIDDFYDQLKEEEKQGLLREITVKASNDTCLLEAT